MIAFSIWPINIYWYWLMFLTVFTVGYLFLKLVAKQGWARHMPKVHEILTTKLDDFVIAAVLGIIVGSRLGEVFFYEPAYYLANPYKIFYVREGGMAFFGGILGILIAMLLFAKKNKLTLNDSLGLFDYITSYAPFAIILGRYVNFLNQELYGLPVPEGAWGLSDGVVSLLTNLNFFYVYPAIDDLLRLNTNFLAMMTEGILLAIIMAVVFFLRYRKGTMKPGSMVAIFIIWYAVFRFFLDFLRIDAQTQVVLGISVTQRFSFVFFGLWAYLLWRPVKS